REAAAEDVDATDLLAGHEIGRRAVVGRIATIGDVGADGVALLQAEEAAAGLHGRVEVGRGQRQAHREDRARIRPVEAEGVRGVRLLCRYDTAARPLRASALARI